MIVLPVLFLLTAAIEPNATIYLIFKESLRPILSSSCDLCLYVYLYIYMSVPFHVIFFEASHWPLRTHD